MDCQKRNDNHTNTQTSASAAGSTHRLDVNTTLDIIQANTHHSVSGSAALREALQKQHNTIALVQEPYVIRGKVSGLNGLKGSVFTPPLQSKTRTFIYIPKPFKASLVTHLCTDDLTVVRMETGLQGTLSTVILASAYLDITEDATNLALEELMQFCATNKLECVMGCDSNAHCTVWGSPDTNERGGDILEFILRYNLNLLNRGSEPTFVTSWARTIIDITIATDAISRTINDWHVATDEYSGSDHRWIRFSLTVGEHEPRTYRNPKKTDGSIFSETLVKAMLEVPHLDSTVELSPQEIETTINYIVCALIKSYEKACPLKRESYNITHKKDKWWNKELTKLRKKVRHHFNRAMNTDEAVDWQEYKKMRHRFKVEVKKSQNSSWRKYSSSIQSESETARLRKVLTSDTQVKLGTLKKADGTYTSSEQEQFELLLLTHFPDCQLDDNEGWESQNSQIPDNEDWAFADSIVTEEALLWAISTFQPHKAPGLDGIFPALLQWGLNKIKTHLIVIFRSCLAWKYIPKAWREVKVVFLPKPGKADYTNPKSFRPITLSSFLLKTMERLCDKYIRGGPLVLNPVHKNQHAYQSGKSTETALHQVVYKIESALESKQSCLATFIDIEGAFDKTTFSSIEEGLRIQGVDNRVGTWVTTMLSNRAASIETAGTTRCRVTKGCPQGGVLSPLLWVVVVNELIELLNKEGIVTVGYADDLAIMVSGLFETTLCEKMQKALKVVEKWCAQHSLSVNPQKTEMVLFTRKTKIVNLTTPSLFGTKLTLSKEVKYLGIWLDSKLLWGKHQEHIITKATNILWQCTRAVGKDWGLKPKLCHWLYTVIVRPVLTYGCVVWWPRTVLATVIAKLQQTQRLACSLISGCMKKTPSAALEIILGLTPLHLHIQQEAMASALRIKSTNQWINTGPMTNHCRIIDRATRIIPEAILGTDKIATTHLDSKKYELITDDNVLDEISPTWNIYTDGAKNKEGAGCGYYSPELGFKESLALNKSTTVLQAEAMGLLLAAKAVWPLHELLAATKDRDSKGVLMFTTDSAATIYALRRPVTRSRVTAECHTALQTLAGKQRTIVRWAKSHGSCVGNTTADTLAKEGSRKQVSDDAVGLCKPSAMGVRELLRRHTEKEQQNLWNKKDDCKHAKAAFPILDRKITNNLLKLQRQDLRLLVGLITGHCNLNSHLYKIGATDSPLCRGCMKENETVVHVLWHCEATEETRISTGLHETSSHLSSTSPQQAGCFSSSLCTLPSAPLEQLCQRPRASLRYFKELGWLG